MKRKKLISIVFSICFLLFIGVLDYPFIARMYNSQVQGKVAVDYEKAAKELQQPEQEEMRKKAERYNEKLASGEGSDLSDAFLATREQEKEYHKMLSTGEDDVMAVIRIPKIQVQLPIYHGTSEEALQRGAGHLEGTSLPVGGSSTHTCISAHRGLPDKKMFTSLDLLEEEDLFYIQVLDEVLAYQVYSIETVTPDQTDPLLIRTGEDLATLITCTPYGINTHRLYVHGKRVPYVEQEEVQQQELAPLHEQNQYWWMLLTVVLLIWMCILLYRFNRTADQNNKKRGKANERTYKTDID